jgi:hypothetical protein
MRSLREGADPTLMHTPGPCAKSWLETLTMSVWFSTRRPDLVGHRQLRRDSTGMVGDERNSFSGSERAIKCLVLADGNRELVRCLAEWIGTPR